MTETTNFSFNLTDFDKIPWHTEEHDNWHLADALLARYLAVSNVQGVWQNALAVTVGQRYIDSVSDTIWEVLVAHTTPSTGLFSVARAADNSNWQPVSVDVSFGGAWTEGTAYSVNEFIFDGGRYGVVTAAHTATTSYDAEVLASNIITLIDVNDLISESPVINDLATGSSATVTYSGATGIFTFGIPTGATGATGNTGDTGAAATIAVGTVATGGIGSSATVVNAGSTAEAVFNFSIPQEVRVLQDRQEALDQLVHKEYKEYKGQQDQQDQQGQLVLLVLA
jgi:hypothetical protein